MYLTSTIPLLSPIICELSDIFLGCKFYGLPDTLLPIVLTTIGLSVVFMIINKYKLQWKVKTLPNKRFINLVCFRISENKIFFFDKFDKEGKYLGLFANGSMKKLEMYNVKGGIPYWGYVIHLDYIMVGNVYTLVNNNYHQKAIWYKITNVNWEFIQKHNQVLSNDMPVIACVNDDLYCEVKIYCVN